MIFLSLREKEIHTLLQLTILSRGVHFSNHISCELLTALCVTRARRERETGAIRRPEEREEDSRELGRGLVSALV